MSLFRRPLFLTLILCSIFVALISIHRPIHDSYHIKQYLPQSSSSSSSAVPRMTSSETEDNIVEEDMTLDSKENSLLSMEAMRELGESFGRSFFPHPAQSSKNGTSLPWWCVPKQDLIQRQKKQQRQSKNFQAEGLLYVRTPKTASSTIVGALLRIVRRYDCYESHFHLQTNNVGAVYGNRNPHRSFLMGSIRNPSKRAMSRIFFTQVSSKGMKPTDKNILFQLRNSRHTQFGTTSEGKGGFQLAYLSPNTIPPFSAWSDFYDSATKEPNTVVLDPQRVQYHVQSIIQSYDFILLVERLDESLVTLSLLFDVPILDVVYTSAKVSGNWLVPAKRYGCVKSQKSFLSDAVTTYLASFEWRAMNYGDFLLHAASNKSLDLTIDAIGRTKFNSAMKEFYRLKALEETICAPTVTFPCTSEGVLRVNHTGCLEEDAGCGYECIDGLI